MPKWTVPPKGGHMDKRTGVMMTERDPSELDAVLNGPRAGGKRIYSFGCPA